MPSYTRAERLLLEAAVQSAADFACPACGGRISRQPVPPPPGVSYVRHRIWIVCVDCKRSVAVDLKSS